MNLHIIIFSILMAFGCTPPPVDDADFKIHSTEVGDDFEIIVNLPDNYSSRKSYPLVLYLDAGINSGKKMPNLVREKKKDVVLVGVKHLGSYKKLRRRDFIQAHMKKKDSDYAYYSNDSNYGQAEKFHSFLKKELLPQLNEKYSISKNDKTLVGHSLGGLFVVYACFRKDRLFDNFLAISPSLWINYQNIWDFERAYFKENKSLYAKYNLAAGSYEIVNLVKYNTNIFHAHISKRNYEWTGTSQEDI
jgi:predicted alpha/beta superfamily hydrolase